MGSQEKSIGFTRGIREWGKQWEKWEGLMADEWS